MSRAIRPGRSPWPRRVRRASALQPGCAGVQHADSPVPFFDARGNVRILTETVLQGGTGSGKSSPGEILSGWFIFKNLVDAVPRRRMVSPRRSETTGSTRISSTSHRSQRNPIGTGGTTARGYPGTIRTGNVQPDRRAHRPFAARGEYRRLFSSSCREK